MKKALSLIVILAVVFSVTSYAPVYKAAAQDSDPGTDIINPIDPPSTPDPAEKDPENLDENQSDESLVDEIPSDNPDESKGEEQSGLSALSLPDLCEIIPEICGPGPSLNSISGMKFNDLNGDGVKDPGEAGLEGWTIILNGPGGETTTVTDSDGNYSFNDLATGGYTVCEEEQAGWNQTFPTTDTSDDDCDGGNSNGYFVQLPLEGPVQFDFGNHQAPSFPCADFNHDGVVTQADVDIAQANSGIIEDPSFDDGDVNGNGVINSSDIGITKSQLGRVCKATLILVKNTNGGDDTFNFQITGAESSSASLTTVDGSDSVQLEINAGTSTITELDTTGWDFTDSNCVYENNDAGEQVGHSEIIHVDDGDEVTCTFTNTEQSNDDTETPGGGSHHHGSNSGNSGGGETGGQVLGAATGPDTNTICEAYLTSYLKIGTNNPIDQMVRLQAFLNEFQNAGVPINGFFDQPTLVAVKAFQVSQEDHIRDPWATAGVPITDAEWPTGYVYKTTKWWINSLKCPSANYPVPQLP